MARMHSHNRRTLPRCLALLLIAATMGATGCTKEYVKTGEVPPRRAATAEQPQNFDYAHKLAPEPDYEPKDVDALAKQFPRPRPYRHPIVNRPSAIVIRDASRARSYQRRGFPSLTNTLFWGAVGAGIGSISGDAGKGAIIGASYGHLLDHGGLHGLLTPGTIIGGAAGAAFSGNRGKGALIGAAAGHLLGDVFVPVD